MPAEKEFLTVASIPEKTVWKVDGSQEPAVPKRALSIQAHPDDQEFSIAGTLAKWARAGCEVFSLCVTSGDSGCNDADKDGSYKPELARLRELEQLAAGKIIGVKETVFLRYPDGELEHTLALRRDITRVIRRLKPEVVLCGDPTTRFYGNSYMNHPDHRVAADAACDAVFPSAGTRLVFPELLKEGLEPHRVQRLFLHGNETPDVWIDIHETIDIKILALREHKTQVGEGKEIGDGLREWAAEAGQPRGLAFAEAFRVMVLEE
jgi:LmbE family N-acetylglucosaminyl deacetylase